jgi:hypothetical protein
MLSSLFVHLIVTVVRLARRGGLRSVVAGRPSPIGLLLHIRLSFATVKSPVRARRPMFSQDGKIWTEEDLREISRNLAVLSQSGGREFYQRAYRECAIINSSTFPTARAVQELV